MRVLLLVFWLCAAGCSVPSSANRVDIRVENRTNRTIRVKASVWLIGRTIVLRPGAHFAGWIPRFGASEAVVVIEDE